MEQETQDTVLERPPIQSRPTGTVVTPVDALRLDEIARSRKMVWVILGIAIAVGGAMPFLPGDPTLEWLLYCGIALGFGTGAWLYYLTADPSRYSDRRIALVWTLCPIAVCVGVFYFGVFSPAPAAPVVGLYFVSLGHSRWIGSMVFGLVIVFQATTSLLITFDVIRDPGLLHADYLDTQSQVIVLILIEVVLISAFMLGRMSRRATLAAVAEHDVAVRDVARRDALLLEARQELDRALKVGGPGRYTDQTIGSYRLGPVIGRGAMGEVYEGTHRDTGEPAAVKVLRAGTMESSSALERFLREARAASALHVPNVVRVLASGGDNDDFPYLAMERLHGEDLGHYLRTESRLSLDKVVDLVRQVADGISAAETAHIVHRDLKPQNLFLAEQPSGPPIWKILDFGVSKLAEHSGTLTQGHVVGTPMYMAPEQAQGKDVDHRADVYALGAIAYRSLTGNVPFAGKDMASVLYNVVHTMPARPSLLVDVPADLDAVLLIGMAKRPSNRFSSASELADNIAVAALGHLTADVRKRAGTLAPPWGGSAR